MVGHRLQFPQQAIQLTNLVANFAIEFQTIDGDQYFWFQLLEACNNTWHTEIYVNHRPNSTHGCCAKQTNNGLENIRQCSGDNVTMFNSDGTKVFGKGSNLLVELTPRQCGAVHLFVKPH